MGNPGRLVALLLKILGLLALGVALLALPPLALPDRHLTPIARALPQDSLPRKEALAAVRQGALAQLTLGGLAGTVLLGLGGLYSEVARLRERLEEALVVEGVSTTFGKVTPVRYECGLQDASGQEKNHAHHRALS